MYLFKLHDLLLN